MTTFGSMINALFRNKLAPSSMHFCQKREVSNEKTVLPAIVFVDSIGRGFACSTSFVGLVL